MLVVTYISLPVQAWNFAGLWVLLFFGLLLVAALSVLVTIVTRGRTLQAGHLDRLRRLPVSVRHVDHVDPDLLVLLPRR